VFHWGKDTISGEDVGSRRSEVRGQKSEVGSRRYEVCGMRPVLSEVEASKYRRLETNVKNV